MLVITAVINIVIMIFFISLFLLIYELEFFNESDHLPYVLIVLSGSGVSECLFLLFVCYGYNIPLKIVLVNTKNSVI